MCQHDVLRATVKASSDPVGEILVRKVTETRQDALFQFPRIIVTRLEHVSAVIRFNHDRGAATEPFGDECGDVTKVHHRRDLHALVRGRETEIVDSVVRNRERMKIDLADAKVFARLDLLDSIAQVTAVPTDFKAATPDSRKPGAAIPAFIRSAAHSRFSLIVFSSMTVGSGPLSVPIPT